MGHEVEVSRGGQGLRPGLLTPTPDAFTHVIQDESEYITTTQLGRMLGKDQKHIHRWCQRWYGPLPKTRRGRKMGYRIHPEMVRVARGWLQTEDDRVRDAIKYALLREPRDWVVMVGNEASTHYTAAEALQRAEQFLLEVRNNPMVISVMYVGSPTTGEEEAGNGS